MQRSDARKGIEILRLDYAILTRDDGKGYYLPETTDAGRADAKRWSKRQDRRVQAIRVAQAGALKFATGWKGTEDRMGKMQREKGKRGERELAGILRDYGYNCRRGQQYCGTSGDADVIGLPNVHIEVKRVEDLRLRKALQQSSRDARAGEIPVVMHRRNREPWKVSMWMENFRKIYSDDVFDDLKPCIRGGIVTLLLDAWICYYRDWQAGKEMGLDGR